MVTQITLDGSQHQPVIRQTKNVLSYRYCLSKPRNSHQKPVSIERKSCYKIYLDQERDAALQ